MDNIGTLSGHSPFLSSSSSNSTSSSLSKYNIIILDRTTEGDSVIDPETGEVICQNQN